jgi:hypothetical protein
MVYVVAIKDYDNYVEFIGYHHTEDQARRSIELLKSDISSMKKLPKDLALGSKVTKEPWWTWMSGSYEFSVFPLQAGTPPFGILEDTDTLTRATVDLYASRKNEIETFSEAADRAAEKEREESARESQKETARRGMLAQFYESVSFGK